MMNTWRDGTFNFVPPEVVGLGIVIAAIVFIISIVLKGYSLWNASKRDEKWWFIILLIVNTFGILELIYLFFVVGKWHGSDKSSVTTSTSTATNNSASGNAPQV